MSISYSPVKTHRTKCHTIKQHQQKPPKDKKIQKQEEKIYEENPSNAKEKLQATARHVN